MIPFGAMSPLDGIPKPPDTIQTLLIAASSGQAMDWASTAAQMVRLSGVSTAGAAINFWANLTSTQCAAPSSGTSTGASTAGSTGVNVAIHGNRTLQIPGGSTGFSVAALSSGYITAEVWRL